jgi:adenosine deaminase
LTIPFDLITRLPKVELHCHLDGSLRISTILDLAKRNIVDLPATTVDGLSKILLIGKTRTSLESYLDRFATS